jgi:acyl-CoA synthetase (AMP-forming)/AMP-acid ligase II
MIFRSPYPHITIPRLSLAEYVLQHAAARGDKPALIDGPTGRTITYFDLSQLVPRVAAGLAARGCRKGDVCAIYSPNLPEYALAFHAAALIGAITTTINPLYQPAELAKQLNDAGARFLFTVPTLLPVVNQIVAETNVEQVFVFGDAADATSFAELAACPAEPPRVQIDPAVDLVALPYSSGTSGWPKGVMLTHQNMVASLCQLHAVGAIKEPDRLICVVPCAHLYGLQVIMRSRARRLCRRSCASSRAIPWSSSSISRISNICIRVARRSTPPTLWPAPRVSIARSATLTARRRSARSRT